MKCTHQLRSATPLDSLSPTVAPESQIASPCSKVFFIITVSTHAPAGQIFWIHTSKFTSLSYASHWLLRARPANPRISFLHGHLHAGSRGLIWWSSPSTLAPNRPDLIVCVSKFYCHNLCSGSQWLNLLICASKSSSP